MRKTSSKNRASIRAPRGYSFNVIPDISEYNTDQISTVYLQLTDSKTRVGHVRLVRRYYLTNPNTKMLETHSYLDPLYRGKGLGALLYAKAIEWALKHGYRVRSSNCPSSDAQNVWKGSKIRTYHHIKPYKRVDGGIHFLAYQKEKSTNAKSR